MKNKRWILDEYPLMIFPSLATEIGLHESIVLQQLHYWLQNESAGIIIDGEKWIYNTYEEWQKNFSFWDTRKIQRVFLSLEKMGLVLSRQPKQYDRTKCYRIDYSKLP